MGCGNTKVDQNIKSIKSEYPTCVCTFDIQKEINSIVAYNDQKIVLGSKGVIEVYDMEKKSIELISSTEHSGRINCLMKLSNGNIVSGGQDNKIKIWDIEKGKCLNTLIGHTSMIWIIIELKDNKILSGADDRNAKIWDLKTNKEEANIFTGHTQVSAAVQIKNGKILISSGKQLILFNLKREQESVQEIKPGIWSMKELASGLVGAGLGNGDVILLEITDEIMVKSTFKKYHTKTITTLIELENHKLVTASDENNMVLWDPSDLDSIYAIDGHTDSITGLANISGNKFASVSKDGKLKIWQN